MIEDGIAFPVQAQAVDIIEVALTFQGYYQIEALFRANGRETIEIGRIYYPDAAHFDISAGQIGTGCDQFISMTLNTDHVVSHECASTFEETNRSFTLS